MAARLICIKMCTLRAQPMASRWYIGYTQVPSVIRALSTAGNTGHTFAASTGGVAKKGHHHAGVSTLVKLSSNDAASRPPGTAVILASAPPAAMPRSERFVTSENK